MWIYDVIKHLIYIISFTLIGCKDSCSCFRAPNSSPESLDPPFRWPFPALVRTWAAGRLQKYLKVPNGLQKYHRWMTTRPILPLFQLVSLREITYLSCHPLLRAAGLSLYNFSSRRVKHTWLSWLLGLWPNFIGTLLKVMKLGKESQKSEKCGSTAFLDDFSVMNFGDEFWWGFDLVTWPYSNHVAT